MAAARIAGIGRFRVLIRHVLPNIAETLIVNATIGAGDALLAFASLSFLGLGVQAPNYDWGRLLGDGLSDIYDHPVAALVPGLAVILAGLAFNLVGETLAKGIANLPDGARSIVPGTRRVADGPQQTSTGEGEPILEVRDLIVSFPGRDAPIRPVRGIDFRIERGEAVGVVGESGSGKSLTALALARLIERPGQVEAEQLRFLGTDLLADSARGYRKLLGTSFAMVFQDPMSSFNPTTRIGRQLAEVSQQHGGLSRRAALTRAVDRLRAVRVPAAERRGRQYPHEFSGGMRQRAMIGMGLMGQPALIVADEPTTALDVTVQQQVLNLLQSIRRADGVALMLISHDVAVVGQICDRVLVMYAGRIVEDLPAVELHTAAGHPYTRALVGAVPDCIAGGAAAHGHPRPGARSGRSAGRLRVRAPVPVGLRAVPRRGSTPESRRAGPAGRLLACW